MKQGGNVTTQPLYTMICAAYALFRTILFPNCAESLQQRCRRRCCHRFSANLRISGLRHVWSRVRQGLEIWRGLPGARSRFAGACTGDMPLSTAGPSILPGAPRRGLRSPPRGLSVPAGFCLGSGVICNTIAYSSRVSNISSGFPETLLELRTHWPQSSSHCNAHGTKGQAIPDS